MLSLGAHFGVGVLIVSSWTIAAAPPEVPAIAVSLVPAPPLPPSPIPPPPKPGPSPGHRAAPAAAHAVAASTPKRSVATETPVHARLPARPAPSALAAAPPSGGGLSNADLAGAATAGSGASDGACDMLRRLQGALRRDPLARAAAVEAERASDGHAIMVWNGDWVQSQSEDGKGLAAVREALVWEVAFAPPACRAEPVRGLVLLTLNDGPDAARLALGSGQWRWSDLLGVAGRR
jgi:hypothetical protein